MVLLPLHCSHIVDLTTAFVFHPIFASFADLAQYVNTPCEGTTALYRCGAQLAAQAVQMFERPSYASGVQASRTELVIVSTAVHSHQPELPRVPLVKQGRGGQCGRYGSPAARVRGRPRPAAKGQGAVHLRTAPGGASRVSCCCACCAC